MGRRRLELFNYALLLFSIVMLVFSVIQRQWFSMPMWVFNIWMNHKLWRGHRRRRAEEVLRKLQEAAWRTRSNS